MKRKLTQETSNCQNWPYPRNFVTNSFLVEKCKTKIAFIKKDLKMIIVHRETRNIA